MSSLFNDDEFDNQVEDVNASYSRINNNQRQPANIPKNNFKNFEDDRQVQQHQPIVDIKPRVNPDALAQLNEENLNSYYIQIEKFDSKEPLLVADEVISHNTSTVEELMKATKYSKDLMITQQSAHVPLYCNRLAHSRIFCDSMVPSDKDVLIKVTGDFFKSSSEHHQGNPRLLLKEVKGNLKNTFLIQVKIENVYSTADFPIAISIGNFVKDDKLQSFSGKKVKRNLMSSTKIKSENQFHEIIAPKSSAASLTLYTSDYEINNVFAMDYPFLTANVDLIKKEVVTTNATCYVPIHSAIARWIFENAAENGWELPAQTARLVGDENIYFTFKQELIEKAANEISALMQRLEIKDLSTFGVQLRPLTDNVKFTDAKNNYVSFTMDVCHVFRDREETFEPTRA